MPLFPEQKPWVFALDRLLQTHESVVGQAPVGFGKTECFCFMTSGSVKVGHEMLIIAPKRPLIKQISERLLAHGVPHGFIAGDLPEIPEAKVQIATPHSLLRRWGRYGKPRFTQVIEDEAHNATQPRYRELHGLLRASGCRIRVGVSATPCNTNGTGMNLAYEAMHVGPQFQEMVELGRLAKPRVFSVPIVTDFKGLTTSGGDYTRVSLEKLLNRKAISIDAIKAYHERTPGKQGLVYCSTVQHCYDFAKLAKEAGYHCEVLEGAMSDRERDDVLQRYKNHEFPLIASCDLITEGYDIPSVEVIILLRKTKSLRILIQAIGRGARSDGGRKKVFYVIDCVGNVYMHGMPDADRLWTLEGGSGKAYHKSLFKLCRACYLWCESSEGECEWCGVPFEKKTRLFKMMASGSLEEIQEVKVKEKKRNRMDEFRERARLIKKDDPQLYQKLRALTDEFGYAPGLAKRYLRMKTGGIKAISEMKSRDRKKATQAAARKALAGGGRKRNGK